MMGKGWGKTTKVNEEMIICEVVTFIKYDTKLNEFVLVKEPIPIGGTK